MLNYLNIVGRLVEVPKLEKTDDGKTTAKIKMEVPKKFKNAKGDYDKDIIECTIWGNVAINTHNYCSAGDVISLKGYLSTKKIEDGKITKNELEVVGETITFISTRNIGNPNKDMER